MKHWPPKTSVILQPSNTPPYYIITQTIQLFLSTTIYPINAKQQHSNANNHSPSQKMQSQAHKKQVVAKGLEHKLHERAEAAGRVDPTDRPPEEPGGMPVPPRRITDDDMVSILFELMGWRVVVCVEFELVPVVDCGCALLLGSSGGFNSGEWE